MRKRILNPEFFTDSDIVSNLDFAGRLFYEGLWCVADDSGCLSLDALSLKMKIFPGDNIDISTIQKYVDILVKIGKIIPYEVDGKQYGWVKNFCKHQHLDRPSPPTVPLPPFIIWHGDTKERHKWYYEVLDTSQNQQRQFDDLSSTSQRTYNDYDTIEKKRIEKKRKEVEVEVNRVVDDEKETLPQPQLDIAIPLSAKLDDSGFKKVASFYEHNFGTLLSPVQAERLSAFLEDGMDPDLVTEIMGITIMGNIYDLRYAEKTLTNLETQGIFTLQQYKEHEAKRELAKKKASGVDSRAAPDNVYSAYNNFTEAIT
ncbi:DnaD domain-containing protein [Mahella australiensis]|uniref:Primosome, DnaD subunit n=1 Tax=Mahella australiensis (strain DSM 15567 / CIP 107919 / 50-1 BON) TaxID=697281 RepID=F3ZZE8_MAHA5|nr:DnaD domain protein [Mahella australiensis]AEE95758.1 primosome, DnaD subunit [Mahella australiensis 50-1 BON]